VALVVNASNSARDIAWIEQHAAGYDARLVDRTDELAMIALQGVISEAVLQRVTTGLDLAELGYYRFEAGCVCGIEDVRVSRTGYTGEDGFEIYLPQDEAVRVWNALLEAGREDGLAPIGLGARDTLRLEAGMPLFGHEISDELNPIEAGLKFGVSFHKAKTGTLGFEALKRFRDQPTQTLVGLTTDGPRVPRQGHDLYRGSERVGFVCSGGVSPTLSTNIATGYLPLALSEPGTELELDLRGKRQPIRVAPQPFYSRTRS
jgi:aminomethyltransferase